MALPAASGKTSAERDRRADRLEKVATEHRIGEDRAQHRGLDKSIM